MQKYIKDKRKHGRDVYPAVMGWYMCVCINRIVFWKGAEVPGHNYVNRKPRKDERGCPIEGEGQKGQKKQENYGGCLTAESGGKAAQTSVILTYRIMVSSASTGLPPLSYRGFWDCVQCMLSQGFHGDHFQPELQPLVEVLITLVKQVNLNYDL